MPKITINQKNCKGCLLCVSFCPRSLIAVDTRLNSKGVRPVKLKPRVSCLGCALCAVICPDTCIEVYK